MSCKLIKSPLTNKDVKSKLFNDLTLNYSIKDAEKMLKYAFSASFISEFGNWTKNKAKDFSKTYSNGEPLFEEVVKSYKNKFDSALNVNKELLSKQMNIVSLSDSLEKSELYAKEAADAIYFYASKKYFELSKTNDVVKASDLLDFAKASLENKLSKEKDVEAKKLIQKVLDNWKPLSFRALNRLEQIGLKSKKTKLEDEDSIIEHLNDDVSYLEGSDRMNNQEAWAYASFQVDPRNTASTKLRMRLSRIMQKEKTYLGTRKLIDFDTAFGTLVRLTSNKPDLNEETLKEILKTNAIGDNSWLMFLYNQLTNPTDDMPQSVKDELYSQAEKNELLTLLKKGKSDFYLVLWNRDKKGQYESQVISSNSQSADKIIVNNWYSNFKNSKYITSNGLEIYVTKESASEIYNRYLELTKTKDLDLQIKELSELLNDIGISISEKQLNLLKDNSKVNKKGKIFNKYIKGKFSKKWEDIVSTKENSYFLNLFNCFNPNIKINNESEESIDNEDKILNYNPFDGTSQVVNYLRETLVHLYRDTAEVLYSDSHKNVAGDTVYAYSQPKMVENIFNKINNSEFEDLTNTFKKSKFNKDSQLLKQIEQGYVKLGYVEGIKKRNDDEGVDVSKQSEKETQLERLSRVLNKGNKIRHIVLPTISDKGRFLQLSIPSIDLTINDKYFSEQNMDLLYDLAKAERQRHLDINNYLIENKTTNNSSIDKGHSLYMFFPLLNKQLLLDKINNGIFNDLTIEEVEDNYTPISYKNLKNEEIVSYVPSDYIIEKVINSTLSEQVVNRLYEWQRIGLLNRENTKAEDVYIDASWIRNAGLKNPIYERYDEVSKKDVTVINSKNLDKAYLQAALEYEFYNLYANGEYYRIFGGDPIGALKSKNSVEDTIQATKVEVIKRNAKDIAPGNEGNFVIWNGETFVEKPKYKTIIINDNKSGTTNEYIKNHPQLAKAYSKIERTDAQEYTTGVEHLDVMFSQGKITDEDYKRIRKKLLSQDQIGPNSDNKLDEKDYKLVMQPLKPVAVDDVETGDGYTWKVYIKSSSIPLIPQYTKGLKIDKLRELMKIYNVERLAHESAVKLGRFNVANVYDETGNINIDFPIFPLELNRNAFRLQQEIPYDENKSEIVFVSQMDKLITESILNLKDFTFKGKTYTGEEIRNLKEDFRKELFNLAKEELLNKIGNPVEVYDPLTNEKVLQFDNLIKLERFIKEQSNASTKLNINDTESIKQENGKFVIPLFFNNSANKFESLLTSLVSKVVLGKITGKKYVQTSGDGWIKSENFNFEENGVVFSDSFNPEKGLQTLRIVDKITGKDAQITSQDFITATDEERKSLLEKYEVKPAQVLVPFKFRNNEGKLLKLKDYTKNGKIDYDKLPKELLRLIGARIPNQGFSSMMPIEIVGFLPKTMGDTMVVPTEWATASGSDYDVDSVYSYQLNTGVDKQGNIKISTDNLTKKIQNDYIDLHWSVLTNPQITDKILSPLDIDDFANAVDLLEESNKKESIPTSLISATYNEKAFIENKSGKDGVGAESLASTFNSVMQKYDIKLEIQEGDEFVPFNLKIKSNGKILNLSHFSKKGFTPKSKFVNYDITQNGLVEKDFKYRTISENISNLQSEAVDNAKSGRLGKGNLNNYTFAAANILLQLQDVSDPNSDISSANVNHVVFLMTQNSILDFVKGMETLNDTTIEDFEPNKKEKLIKNLLDNYYAKANMKPNYNFDKSYILPSEEELFRIGKMDKNSEAYNLHQAQLLKFFLQLESLGNNMRDIMTSLNADTKGSGKSLVESNIKYDKYNDVLFDVKLSQPWTSSDSVLKISGVNEIANSETQQGTASEIAYGFLDNLFGQFYIYKTPVAKRILKLFSIFTNKPSTNSLGESNIRSIFNGLKSFMLTSNSLGVLDFDAETERERLFKTTYASEAPLLSLTTPNSLKIASGKATIAKLDKVEEGIYRIPTGQFVELKVLDKEIDKNTATKLLGYEKWSDFEANDPYNLYFDEKRKNKAILFSVKLLNVPVKNYSLARRTLAMKKMLPENYLLKRLESRLSNNFTKELDLVVYNSSISQNIDDVENTKAFVELLNSENEIISEYAQDLIKYFYLSGGITNNLSFGQYIPSSLLLNSQYSYNLQKLENKLYDTDFEYLSFIRQYFQHNPKKAIKIADDQVYKLLEKDGTIKIAIDQNKRKNADYVNTLFIQNKFTVSESNQTGLKNVNIPFPYVYIYDKKNKKPNLFELAEEENFFVYYPISTLGTSNLGSTEYSMTNNLIKSIIPKNVPDKHRVVEKNNNVKNSIELPEPVFEIDSDIKDKYKLSEKASKETTQLVLSQIKTSQNKDLALLAEILEQIPSIKETTIQLDDNIDSAGRAYANAKKIVFKTSELETSRMNNLRSKTNSNDFNFQSLAIHELLHVATSERYNLYEKNKDFVTEKEQRIFEQLDKIKNTVLDKLKNQNITLPDGKIISFEGYNNFIKKHNSLSKKEYDNLDVSIYYSLSNTKEFITAAMTDSTMQNLLNEIKYSGDKSFFARVKDLINRFINELIKINGITLQKDSALGYTIANVIDLISENNKIKQSINQIVKRQPNEYTPENITSLKPNEIFVFGSNSEGIHGKGAALIAKQKFGAIQGQAEGLQGQSYAVITKKDWKKEKSSTLGEIQTGIVNMLKFASENTDKKFLVTKLGSSLAGYTTQEIKNLFVEYDFLIPNNVILPKEYEVRDVKKDLNTIQTDENGVEEADIFQYYGKQYTILLDNNGKAIHVNGYKGKPKDMQKILDAYNANPDVDPQNGKYFRNEPTISPAEEFRNNLKEAIKNPSNDELSPFANKTNFPTININGINIETSTFKNSEKIGITLNQDQQKALQAFANDFDNFLSGKNSNGIFRLLGGGGRGKAQPLYSKIYTPDGYKLMRDIKVGDEILTENSSKSIVTGVFPQGIKKLYRVYFSDKTYVDCCNEHLWKVYSLKDRKHNFRVKNKDDKHSILTTEEIGKSLYCRNGKELNYKLPISKALNFSKKDLKINPYLLGLLIGDGGLTKNIMFSTKDYELIDYISEILNKDFPNLSIKKISDCDYRISRTSVNKYNTNLLNQYIKDYKLNCKSEYKFIPKEYLYSDIQDRIALLQGLLDTDGSCFDNGMIVNFSSSSEQLAKDVVELVQSLGCIASLRKKKTKCLDHYIVNINQNNEFDLFKLKRKQEKVVPKTKYKTTKYITKVEHIGEELQQCISVSNPTNLYITDNCVVTHNTTLVKIMLNYAVEKARNTGGVITPTHAAGKVAAKALTGKSKQYSTIAATKFAIKNGNYPTKNIIVYDEISMIGDSDSKYLFEKLKTKGKYQIVMGDKYQLPPIMKNPKVNWFFEDTMFSETNSFELTKPERFGEGSDIFNLTEHVRENINVLGGGIKQYGDTDEIKILEDKNSVVSTFLSFYNNSEDPYDKMSSKIIAYGNATVDAYNTLVRKNIFGQKSEQPVLKGDVLIGNKAIGISPSIYSTENSEEYLVTLDPEFITFKFNGVNLKDNSDIQFEIEGYSVTASTIEKNIYDRTSKQLKWVDLSNPKNEMFAQYIFTLIQRRDSLDPEYQFGSKFNALLQEIENSGIVIPNVLYRSNATGKIVDFKKMFSMLKDKYPTKSQIEILDIIDSGIKDNKITVVEGNVSHGYAITSHKAQGKTYENVIVDEENISYREAERKTFDRNGKVFGYEANHMRYVAFSRASKKLFIYTKKTGDRMIYEKADKALPVSNIIKISNLDSYLNSLSAAERIAFLDLKRNKIIQTQC